MFHSRRKVFIFYVMYVLAKLQFAILVYLICKVHKDKRSPRSKDHKAAYRPFMPLSEEEIRVGLPSPAREVKKAQPHFRFMGC